MGAPGDAIRWYRKLRDLTQGELADLVRMSQGAISDRENGKTEVSPREQRLFAKALGVTIEEFEAKWRGRRVHDRPAPKGIPVINRGPAGSVLPYDHDHFAAGEYHNALEYIDRGEPGTPLYVGDDMAYALVIEGDSMEPSLFHGDLVIFSPVNVPKPAAKLEDGKVVCVRFTSESGRDGVTVARWHNQPGRKVNLAKDNPKYPPILADAEDIAQVAVAVQRRSTKGL